MADPASPQRYYLVGDNSGHRYYIPVEKYPEWASFTALDEDDVLSWAVPEYAVRVEGHFTFTDPRCD